VRAPVKAVAVRAPAPSMTMPRHGRVSCQLRISRVSGARSAAPAGPCSWKGCQREPLAEKDAALVAILRPIIGAPAARWVALLGLCASYLQGGFNKLTDFSRGIAEMQHFGLSPPAPLAVVTIVLELGASVLILAGIYRWIGALALAGFTLMATFIANRFWQMAPPERFMAANGFFEHLGLVGGFLLVAWHDIRDITGRRRASDARTFRPVWSCADQHKCGDLRAAQDLESSRSGRNC
jgi:uncharacterized membrane protein YphA (DoxX/SURF4 family)